MRGLLSYFVGKYIINIKYKMSMRPMLIYNTLILTIITLIIKNRILKMGCLWVISSVFFW